jgi:hypothetical protein
MFPLVHDFRHGLSTAPELLPALPGQRLQRGVCRGLRALDFACVEDLVPTRACASM